MCLNQNNIFLDVSSLKTNIIAQFKEPTYRHCALHCAEHRFCVAINYKEKVEGNEPNCQLTNTTEHNFNKNNKEQDRVWTFRRVNVDRSQVVSTSNNPKKSLINVPWIVDPEIAYLKYSSKVRNAIKLTIESLTAHYAKYVTITRDR
jgi:hypothetical protein